MEGQRRRGDGPFRESRLTGELCALYRGARAVACALSLGMTQTGGKRHMCKLCDEGIPQSHSASRRDFLKATAATGAAAASLNLFAPRRAAADGGDPPEDTGRPGRRYVIRGGSVMSIDRKSTRLNSSHSQISYAVFCLKKKKKKVKSHTDENKHI